MNFRKLSPFFLVAVLAALSLFLAGCRGAAPTPTPAPPVAPPFNREDAPEDEAVAIVENEKGGTIVLQDGAQVTLPGGALTGDATVTFRTVADPPAAPIPSSITGQAYELLVEGAEMSGVALLQLPLIPGVTPDQYEIAPYRWNGRVWERVTTRDATGGIGFGVSEPGLFALLGRWRLADATLALVKPDTVPGQQAIPLTVVGQYRYSTIPALQDGLVTARLDLKQDSSGGAGLVAGDPNQDATVDETVLYFKPDLAQSSGVIEFNHAFELTPGLLNLDPGVSTRFYVVLTVDDSAAPTRRVSTGVEYTQILPIQFEEMDVVRPIVLEEERIRLRWKIMLNGLTFQTLDARGPRLALQPIIDQGGVGDYRIVLEVEQEGVWAPISNELSLQLALRGTPTPTPGLGPTPTAALIADATIPAPQPPEVPTRRPVPPRNPAGGTDAGSATQTPTSTPTPDVTPSPTVAGAGNVLRADRAVIAPGECTNLRWRVENVISVTFEGQPATGDEIREVCPTQTTTYTLRTTSASGSQDHTVTVQVTAATPEAVTFTADKLQVAAGTCTFLRWSATNVKEVRLNGQGVAGVASQEVCPLQTTVYNLSVLNEAGQTTTKTLTITVSTAPGSSGAWAFYAEQYTLPAGSCTFLHWRVENVQRVVLDGQGVEGVGSDEACPVSMSQVYQLEVTDTNGVTNIRYVTLSAGAPTLLPNEVIAQGVVNEVSAAADVNGIEPGDQPGYNLVVAGLRVLHAGTPSYSQGQVVLRVSQEAIELGDDAAVHWPVRVGQSIEFRSPCDAATCLYDLNGNSYLYWRSE